MAKKIILVDEETNQKEILISDDIENIQDQSWEEDCFRIGCQVSKALAERYLKEKDNEILKERPSDILSKTSMKGRW